MLLGMLEWCSSGVIKFLQVLPLLLSCVSAGLVPVALWVVSEVKELDSYLNSLLRCDEALNINCKTVLRVAWGGGYGAEVHQGWFVKVLLIGSPP